MGIMVNINKEEVIEALMKLAIHQCDLWGLEYYAGKGFEQLFNELEPYDIKALADKEFPENMKRVVMKRARMADSIVIDCAFVAFDGLRYLKSMILMAEKYPVRKFIKDTKHNQTLTIEICYIRDLIVEIHFENTDMRSKVWTVIREEG